VAILSNGDLSLIGLADSSPRNYSQAQYYPNVGLGQAGGQFAAYGEIYKRQLWVATLVNKLAYGTARLPLKVYSRTDDSRTEARDTAYAKLIRTRTASTTRSSSGCTSPPRSSCTARRCC
jgi:hypothetical protein